MEAHLKTFLAAVNEMRLAQKNYFATRSPHWLREAKQKEIFVDKFIFKLKELETPQPTQTKLHD